MNVPFNNKVPMFHKPRKAVHYPSALQMDKNIYSMKQSRNSRDSASRQNPNTDFSSNRSGYTTNEPNQLNEYGQISAVRTEGS